jgi:t-SNARE complex subunit (syntaxin)
VQEDLSQRYEQTKSIEQNLHQIAEMNRAMATELTSQMEMAEKMYTDALFATTNLERGNVQLGKAAKVKKESGCNSFIVLVAAAILLLLVDYVYPG